MSTKPFWAQDSDKLLDADFTVLPLGGLTSTKLPDVLVLARAAGTAASETVQTGTSQVVTTNITANVPRVGRRLDTDLPGLVLEETRVNKILNNRDGVTGWSAQGGTTTQAYAAGVDGSPTTAFRMSAASGQVCNLGPSSQTVGAPVALSGWMRATTPGTNDTVGILMQFGTLNSHVTGTTGTTAFTRYSNVQSPVGNSTVYLGPVEGRSNAPIAAAARDFVVDLVQSEAGGWVSEAILVAGANSTRSPERLYHPTASTLVRSGRLAFSVSLRPKSTAANFTATSRVWTSGSDYCEIASTGVMTISIGGVTNTTVALSWAQYDSLDLYVGAGGGIATRVGYRVNGGATTYPTVTGAVLGNVSIAGTLDLLCNGTASQFSAWITSIQAWKVGTSPSWVVDSTPTLLAADFTTLAAGAAATLPGGLAFARALGTAASETVQTGTSTVVTTGLIANVARVGRRLTTDTLGLVLEESRVNWFPYARAPNAVGLAAGSGDSYPTTNNAQPDGGVLGIEMVVPSGGWGKNWNTASTTHVMSQWVIKGPGTGAYGMAQQQASAADGSAVGGIAATSYTRIITTSATSQYAQPCDGRALNGVAAGARDVVVDLIHWESGRWSSEAIVSAGASATRNGERLYHPTASSLVQAGRLSLSVSLRPKCTPANFTATSRVWTSGSDYCEIASTGVMTISVGGVTNVTSAITWAAYDTLDIYVATGGGSVTQVTYRVNGGIPTYVTVTGLPLGNVSTASTLDLLCNGTASQFSAWITNITAWKSGQVPTWAITEPTILNADFTALTPGAVATLPSGFVLTRTAGTAASETVQTGLSTVVTTGITANVARAGRHLSPYTARNYPQALQFDGTVKYGTATAVPFAAATQTTLCGWVKNPNNVGGEIILETSSDSGVANAFFLLNNGSGTLQMRVHDQTNARTSTVNTGALATNRWYRFTLVIDETLGSAQALIYLDGIANTASRPSDQQCLAGIDTNSLVVGLRVGGTNRFSGSLVLDRITTGKAYTAAEALAEYQTGVYPSGGTLLANYNWTNITGQTTIIDNGTGAKNIVLTNSPVWTNTDTPSIFPVGLVLEETRTNSVPASHSIPSGTTLGWTAGTGTTTVGQAAPDGSTAAVSIVCTSAQYGSYNSGAASVTSGLTYTVSQWTKAVSVGANDTYGSWTQSPLTNFITGTATANWLRYAFSPLAATGTANVQYVPNDGRAATPGLSAANRSMYIDMPQVELGKWPSEAIITAASATATRSPERLYYPVAANLITNGRLAISISLRPKSTAANFTATSRVWTSGSDYCEIASNGVMTISVGGVTNTTAAIVWAQYDSLDLYIATGGNVATTVAYRVNGGAKTSPAVAGATLGNISVASTLDVLCNGTASQFSAWVTNVSVWKWTNGARPSWV